jgi:hypothetical protein
MLMIICDLIDNVQLMSFDLIICGFIHFFSSKLISTEASLTTYYIDTHGIHVLRFQPEIKTGISPSDIKTFISM